MISIESADQALRSYYLDVISEQLNNGAGPFLADIEKTSTNVYGKEIRKIVHYGLSRGVAAVGEAGDLPTPGNGSNYAELCLPLKNIYGHMQITDKAIRATQNNAGAFIGVLESEMQNLIDTAKFNFSRMLFGTEEGIITYASSQTGNKIYVESLKGLMEGMSVDIVSDSTGAVVLSDAIIQAINMDDDYILIGERIVPANTVAEGDYIVLHGSYCNELTGLGSIFDPNLDLYGCDRSDYRWLTPYSKSSSTISDTIIQGVIDTVEERAGSQTNYLLCSNGVKRAYQNYLSTNRTNINVMDLQGGYKAISFNGIPLVSDRFCPSGTMYLLNSNDFHLYQLCDWRWLEDDAGRVLRQVPNKAAYSATLVKYADLMCDKPYGQGKIYGITEA